MTEEALVRRDPDACTFDLAASGLTTELPGELTHLGDGLSGNGFAEAGQSTRRVDRHPTAERGVTVAEQSFGFTLLAQVEILIPVELEC